MSTPIGPVGTTTPSIGAVQNPAPATSGRFGNNFAGGVR
jgi:hypothetical protein